jgi:signal transduction histidine kinase
MGDVQLLCAIVIAVWALLVLWALLSIALNVSLIRRDATKRAAEDKYTDLRNKMIQYRADESKSRTGSGRQRSHKED